MKGGFTIGRFITSQTNGSWLGEGESPITVVHRSKFEAKYFFSIFFKLNGSVLIHCVDEGNTTDHNFTILKIASGLLSRKYENKEGQQVQRVRNGLRSMLDFIFILTRLII